MPNDEVLQEEELYYTIALTLAPGIGSKTGKLLLSHCGSAKSVFNATIKDLNVQTGISDTKLKGLKDHALFAKAERELKYMQQNGIAAFALHKKPYPTRLANCEDAPLLVYYKGTANVDAPKMVAIVGTRKNTDYGRQIAEDLIDQLAPVSGLCIVSGLAAGIDAIAHKRCLALNIPTIGVLAHGLERMYPFEHRELAASMASAGGLLTEFTSHTLPDKGNFPKRNRIVAGLCDLTVVIESTATGGAMITARLAREYNREVAAYPGRATDSRSEGCNELIRRNIASLATNAQHLIELMNWDAKTKQKPATQIPLHLSKEEVAVIEALQNADKTHADDLMLATGIAVGSLSSMLLQLEMQGLVTALPGKYYKLR